MTAPRFDFVHPDLFPSEAKEKLNRWLADLGAAVARRWGAQLPFQVTFEAEPYATGPAAELTRAAGPEVVGVRLGLEGKGVGIAYAHVPIVTLLVAGMLGDVMDQLPEAAELTPIETALFEVLCHEFVEAIAETWPSKEVPELRLGHAQPGTELRRAYAPFDPLVQFSWKMTTDAGEGHWRWLLPLRWIVDRMVRHGAATPSRLQHPDITAIPLEMTVWLGETELSVAELRSLRRGDVLLLSTSVEGHLPVAINDRRMFEGRPVRIGLRQAVQITSRIEE